MSARRDTRFPGQQSSVPHSKNVVGGTRGLLKAPLSTINYDPKFRSSDKLGGDSGLEKAAVSTSFKGQLQDGVSKIQVTPKLSPGRRDTGFPGQQTGIPYYKTQLGIPKDKKKGNGTQNHEAHSQVPVTTEKAAAADVSKTKRRDTGMIAQKKTQSFFGQKRKPKVHGENNQDQRKASPRANALPVIGENVRRHRASEFHRIVAKTLKNQIAASASVRILGAIRNAKNTAVTARASMFSASRRIARRSMLMFSADGERMSGRMTVEDDLQLEEYTMEEISKHNTDKDAWVVLHGRVYDVTKWMWYHPGREEVLQENAGKDASFQFEANFHSRFARDTAKKYVIGKVKGKELGDLHQGVSLKTINERPYTGLSGRMTIFVVILAVLILRMIIVLSFE